MSASSLLKKRQKLIGDLLEMENVRIGISIVVTTAMKSTADPVMDETSTRMDTDPSADAETAMTKTGRGLIEITGDSPP